MESVQLSNEKKLTVLLLCWLFGLFGVHHFYTGKYFAGTLQLLIITLGGVSAIFKAEILPTVGLIILAAWWVVDMARIIMGRFTDKEGRPIVDWV